jgi:Protein of unknown function (DUF4238)
MPRHAVSPEKISMPGKRQHYVSRFHLARFRDPSDEHGRVWRAGKDDDSLRLVVPRREAAIDNYYRIVLDDGTIRNDADDLLTNIDNAAAPVIVKVADREYRVSGQDVYDLLQYIVTLHNRTPQPREALEEVAARGAEMQFEVLLSDRERHHATMAKSGRTAEEIEQQRLKMLADLRDGRLELEAPPGQVTGMMFVAIGPATDALFESLGVTCLRPASSELSRFILSDHPVSHCDPKPKLKDAAAGFLSSDPSATWVPLDPDFGVLLTQQATGTWAERTISQQEIDELNVQTYAWAREAIYSPSAVLANRVREYASTQPQTRNSLTNFGTDRRGCGSHALTAPAASTSSYRVSGARPHAASCLSPKRVQLAAGGTRGRPDSAVRRQAASYQAADRRPRRPLTRGAR